jgi:mRNA interferase MazF
LDDAEGYEQQNERPLVIVSNNKQNEIERLLVVVPLSRSTEKVYPFQVATFFNDEPGKTKCEQVRAITIERLERKLGSLTEKEINAIEEKLVMILALEDYIERKIKERIN